MDLDEMKLEALDDEAIRAQHIALGEARSGTPAMPRSFGPAHCGADGAIRSISAQNLIDGALVSQNVIRKASHRRDAIRLR